jgi:hypothetical protein
VAGSFGNINKRNATEDTLIQVRDTLTAGVALDAPSIAALAAAYDTANADIEASLQDVANVLNDILGELLQKIEAGEDVGLTEEAVTALATAVATLFHYPADYPDATASTKLDTLHSDVSGVRTDLGTDGTSPPALGGSGTGVRGFLRTILDKLNSTLAVTQSGTWTVQPGNTPNTAAWKVDGSATTQPVSAAALTNGSAQVQVTNGVASVEINAAGDNNALYVHQQTKTQTLTFTSPNSSSAAINCDGYDTVEVIVTSGSTLATPKFSNDGVTFVAAQWYRWTDLTGPFTAAVTHGGGLKYTAKVAGHYFRIENTTLTTNPTTVDVILSSKPFVAPVETVTVSSGTITSITNQVSVTDRGATGSTNPSVAMTTTSSTMKANNAGRKKLIIQNTSGQILYVLFGNATVSSTLHSVSLAAGDRYVEDKYTGIVTGVLASGTGNAMVTEIT